MRNSARLSGVFLLALVSACGHGGVVKGPGGAPVREPGYDLLLLTTGCWFGGVWADAQGLSDEEARKAAMEKRCGMVPATIPGMSTAEIVSWATRRMTS